ncbi:aspartate/glutamate racemase family protein [Halobium salinum]|uniref:Aspartate/glutamate racemase family protein n=1 Tax=Halobium salinum TaxID=1364940 RepID=A0ABD5PCY9_9EURY|nr:aspartate/glutamate racemase family protein [Halobium salinum]
MYGWRGRLGLIVPSSNTTNEPEFRAHLPDGVSLHAARMRLESVDADALSAMADEAERCGSLLATADVDAVAYGCTTGSLVHGPGYDREIEDRVSAAADAPAVATAASVVRALEHLGVDRVAVTTPYVDDLVAREETFLEDAGFDVVAIEGLGIEANTDIGREPPESVYRRARELPTDEADAVFVSCTNYRTVEVLQTLERDLGLPVVSSNAATLWDALRTLGVDGRDVGLGRLFEW